VGEPLAAEPVSVNRTAIDRAHERGEIVLVPGYCAVDESGRTVLLGRGGSDSTALFLASRLGADRCRLLKDVDGLYTSDPRRQEPPPARYAAATWEDALATDGTILQHAAVQLAQREARCFELGRLGGTRPTRLGVEPRALEGEPDLPRKLSVALTNCLVEL